MNYLYGVKKIGIVIPIFTCSVFQQISYLPKTLLTFSSSSLIEIYCRLIPIYPYDIKSIVTSHYIKILNLYYTFSVYSLSYLILINTIIILIPIIVHKINTQLLY